jgi:glycosyltransferase involved in cell wall biosynthesis
LAVKVIELEITQAIPNLTHLDLKHYSHLQILVRKNRRPLGYVWIQLRSSKFLTPNFIQHEIERQLFDTFNHAILSDREATPFVEKNFPSVTVALCTRGRPKSLEKALKSLTELDYPSQKLEVLIVDNAPPDNATAEVVSQFPQFLYTLEPRPGLDWARNHAINEANGEIIAFTDDDVEVDRFWLQAIVPHFENPAVMCVTGLVAPAERETEAQNLFEEYNGFGKGFEVKYYTLGVRAYWPTFPLGSGNFGTGANMAYRKTIFNKIGFFDEALDVGTPTHGAGDLEMFYRVVRNGYILVYEPQALIWHYHRENWAVLQGQIRDWGRGVYAFWTKVFLTDPKMRFWVLQNALTWLVTGNLLRLRHLKGKHRQLKLAEIRGIFQGPIAYMVAKNQAEKIRRDPKYIKPADNSLNDKPVSQLSVRM